MAGDKQSPCDASQSPGCGDHAAPDGQQRTTRAFLVGCERSGTTLLQSLLAAHRNVHSIPETHFVKQLFRNEPLPADRGTQRSWPSRVLRILHARRRDLMARAGWIGARNAAAAWREVEGQAVKPASAWCRHSARAHMQCFASTMDRACHRAGKRVWIEKTPEHLFYVGLIQRHVPGVRFIHIVRDGTEVVASLNRLAVQYPNWRRYADPTVAVDRWNQAWRETLRWVDCPGHLVVRYEALQCAPQRTLAAILTFLGCDPDERVWAQYPEVARGLIRDDEPWKKGNLQSLRDCRKFAYTFDASTQATIRQALDEPDWNTLSRLRGVIGWALIPPA